MLVHRHGRSILNRSLTHPMVAPMRRVPAWAAVLTIVLTVAILAALNWLLRLAVYDWLPQQWNGYILVAMLAFAVGLLVGHRSGVREVEQRLRGDPRWDR